MESIIHVFNIDDLFLKILNYTRKIDRPYIIWSLFRCGLLEETGIEKCIENYYTDSSWYRDKLSSYNKEILKTIASELGYRRLSRMKKEEIYKQLSHLQDMLHILPVQMVKMVIQYETKLKNANALFKLTGVKLEVTEEIPVYLSSIHDVLPSLVENMERTCTKSSVKHVFKLPDSAINSIACHYVDNPHYKCAPQMRLYSLKTVLERSIEHYGGSWVHVLSCLSDRQERKRKR